MRAARRALAALRRIDSPCDGERAPVVGRRSTSRVFRVEPGRSACGSRRARVLGPPPRVERRVSWSPLGSRRACAAASSSSSARARRCAAARSLRTKVSARAGRSVERRPRAGRRSSPARVAGARVVGSRRRPRPLARRGLPRTSRSAPAACVWSGGVRARERASPCALPSRLRSPPIRLRCGDNPRSVRVADRRRLAGRSASALAAELSAGRCRAGRCRAAVPPAAGEARARSGDPTWASLGAEHPQKYSGVELAVMRARCAARSFSPRSCCSPAAPTPPSAGPARKGRSVTSSPKPRPAG